MTVQNSVAERNARLDAFEDLIGASPTLNIYTGSQPANCAAADTGTLLISMTLPSDWMSAAASGSKSMLGTWTGTAVATGIAGYYRIKDSSTVVHEQGLVSSVIIYNTSGTTSALGNVLTLLATTGIVTGMSVSGSGIPAGATVIGTTSGTVTLSLSSITGVSSGVAITFSGDISLNNLSIASGQVVSLSTYTKTAGNP